MMTSGNVEAPKCPLCMEPLEIDDINFYPCTCGFQVCTFCWHRIRTNENGLCPACRKLYPENPAEYIPLTAEQVQKSKDSRKQRSQKKKGQTVENRKNLEGVRVIRLNLVFITGLPPRVADSDVLKRYEYCGQFGQIRNIRVSSTEFHRPHGPSLSAHVTYARKENAAKAIATINNTFIDGYHLKLSFGTSKYCSKFRKCQPCYNHDCTFLHELGSDKASFTKEEMRMNKHVEFEAAALADLLADSDKPRELTGNPALQSNARKIEREPVVETKPDEMTSNVKAKRESPHAEEPTETHENSLMEPLNMHQIFNDTARLSMAFNPTAYPHPVSMGSSAGTLGSLTVTAHQGHVAQQSVWQEGASEEEEEEKLLREAMNSAILDTGVELPEALRKKSDTEESSGSSKEPRSVGIGRPLGESWAPSISIQSEWPLLDEETTNEDDLEFEVEKQSETKGKNSVNADGSRQKGLLPNVNINFANSVRPQYVAVTSANSDVFVTQSSRMPQGLLMQGSPSSLPPPASRSVPLGAMPGLPSQQYVWT